MIFYICGLLTPLLVGVYCFLPDLLCVPALSCAC